MAVTRSNIGNLFFNYRGDWNNSDTYSKDDVVIYNNTDYICVREQGLSANTRPKQNTQYYYKIQSAVDPSDSTTKFYFDFVSSSVNEYRPELFVNRGDKIVFIQNNNNNDDHPLAIATTSTNQTSNLLTEGISYYHNGEIVSQADYVNTAKFNPKTERRVVLEITKDTPDEIWYFSHADGATYGNKIVVADWTEWKPIRNSFRWRGLHDNTAGTVYYENDIVQVRLGIDNNIGTDYEPNQQQESLATYICVREHTSDGTNLSLPQHRDQSTEDNMKWLNINKEYEYDDETFTDSGAIRTVNSFGAADSARLQGIYRFVQGTSGGSGYPGMFKVVVEGDGHVKAVDTFSAADPLRVAGTYTGVTPASTTGVGTGATFNITVDSTGAVTKVEPVKTRNKVSPGTGGTGFVDDEELTFADGTLGGGGAADFTCQVNGVGVAGQVESIEVERVWHDHRKNKRYFKDFGAHSGGEGNAVGDTITFSGGQFGGGADLTCVVAETELKARGSASHFTGNPYDCVSLWNRGPVGDDNPYYRLPGQHTYRTCVNNGGFHNGVGNTWEWGSSGNNNAYSHDFGTATQRVFPHYDWWRSTDNGGSGVHSTPDGEIPKIIQRESTYQGHLWLMNSGEVYHGGYGGHGQNGDASTSDRNHPVRVGGTNQNVFQATNTSTHVWRDTRIKRIWLSGKGSGDNQNAHSCYALDETGGLWSWGYNAYGQLGTNNTTNYNVPQLIDKATYFNNQEIVAFWVGGAAYASCYAIAADGKFYVWGYNGYGQLGINDTTNRTTPVEVTSSNGQDFTDAGVGKIKKLLCDERGSYGRAAILTEKGTIYTCGYNANGGWMGNGNETQLNQWTINANGPGNAANADCENMWFTGNGQYGSFWCIDSLGNLMCAGYNGYYQLGVGNTTNQTTWTTPKVQIGSTTLKDFRNVKQVVSYGHFNDHCIAILTWDGFVFMAGRNNYGMAAIGFSTGNNNADRDEYNQLEVFNDGYFQHTKLPPSLQGNVEDINGCGYGDNADTNYGWFEWKSYDNRYYINGYGGGYLQGTNDGQYAPIPHQPCLG